MLKKAANKAKKFIKENELVIAVIGTGVVASVIAGVSYNKGWNESRNSAFDWFMKETGENKVVPIALDRKTEDRYFYAVDSDWVEKQAELAKKEREEETV